MLTFPDKVLIGVLLVLSIVSFLAINILKTEGTVVVIEQGYRVLGRYPLKHDREIAVVGPLGKTHVEIKNGQVCIVDSPCPQKVCVRMGQIHRVGDIVVCAPNQVLVRIEGKRDQTAPDAISR